MPIPTEDWIALYDLVTRYSRALDTRDYELLRTVWTDTPFITYDFAKLGVDASMLTYRSADELISDVRNIHAPLVFTMHRNSNHWFVFDGDHATGRVYVDLFQARDDVEPPRTVHHCGWYDDTYVRIAGDWKIAERHFTFKWTEGDWLGGTPRAKAAAESAAKAG